MSIPPEAIDKYRKILAYAERGEGGERNNANRLLESMRSKYPGIEQAVAQKQAFEQPGSFIVPDGPPPPGFWEAAFDAAGLVMGRARPEDLLFKYMDILEHATSPVPGGSELAQLSDAQAKQLVMETFLPRAGRTPFNGLKVKVDTVGNAGGYLVAYAEDEQNRRLIAKHFGLMMQGLMYQLLGRSTGR